MTLHLIVELGVRFLHLSARELPFVRGKKESAPVEPQIVQVLTL